MSKEKYVDFLKSKFGYEIVNEMINSTSKIELKMGRRDDIYFKDMSYSNKEIVKELVPEYKDIIEKEDWAFDFPGWIGDLDFSEENVKEIMVVGMEPHIRETYYQTTYGLRETKPNSFEEINDGNNKKLWSNLNDLFGYSKNHENKEFLSRLYVTDMSHFAVKGKAKEIHKINNWNIIRNNIARKYLLDEIKLIKPKYIISQGNIVADFIDEILHQEIGEAIATKHTSEFKTELPKQCVNSPMIKKYKFNNNQLIHVKLPHIASGNSNYFWTPAQKENRHKRLTGIRNELFEFIQ